MPQDWLEKYKVSGPTTSTTSWLDKYKVSGPSLVRPTVRPVSMPNIGFAPPSLPELPSFSSQIPAPVDLPLNRFQQALNPLESIISPLARLKAKADVPLLKGQPQTTDPTAAISFKTGRPLTVPPSESNQLDLMTSPTQIALLAAGAPTRAGTLAAKGVGLLQTAQGLEDIGEGNTFKGAVNIGMGALGLGQKMPKRIPAPLPEATLGPAVSQSVTREIGGKPVTALEPIIDPTRIGRSKPLTYQSGKALRTEKPLKITKEGVSFEPTQQPTLEGGYFTGGPEVKKLPILAEPQHEAIKFLRDVEKIHPSLAGTSKDVTARNLVSKWYDKAKELTSIDNRLKNYGRAGVELQKRNVLVDQESAKLASDFEKRIDDIFNGLSKEQVKRAQESIENGVKTGDDVVDYAVYKYRVYDKDFKETIKQYGGLRNPETKRPVEMRENYWPRVRPQGETVDQLATAILQKWPKMKPESAKALAESMQGAPLDRVMATGKLSMPEAEKLLKLARRFGERKISPQYSRELDLPGYDVSIRALKKHAYEVSRKLVEQKYYGRGDIGVADSPISQLIKQTTKPEEVSNFYKVILGRAEPWAGSTSGKVNEFAARAAAAAYLSMFRISNLAGIVPIAQRAGFGNASKAILSAMSKESQELARQSGALENVSRGVLEHYRLNKIDKTFGISSSEKFLRTIGAVAGRLQADDIFKKIKAGTATETDEQLLQDLIMQPASVVRGQNSLTKKQLEMAAFRMPELTQGMGIARRLPKWTSNPSPFVQIPIIFRKFAMQQTGNIIAAAKTNPGSIPRLVIAAQIAGEGLGDVKAGIRGGVSAAVSGKPVPEGAWNEIANRGDYIGSMTGVEDPAFQRLLDNANQAWMLGLLGDVVLAGFSGSELAWYKTAAGPALSLGTDVGVGTLKAAFGKPEDLGRDILKSVPFNAGGLQKGLLPTEYQKRKQNPFGSF